MSFNPTRLDINDANALAFAAWSAISVEHGWQTLVDGMATLGFKPFLRPEVQAPIIVTFHAPAHANYDFKKFYEGAKARGFMLYPGKLTQVETFRVGCIGAIGPNEMRQAVEAIADTLREMQIPDGKPAL